jgi:hypothetical protein
MRGVAEGEGRVGAEDEVQHQYSATEWAACLQECCAERVATTVQTDIDAENYQWMTGPP